MSDLTTNTTPAAGRPKSNGFGMFVGGLVLGIIVGGFAGAVLLPFLNQQSMGTAGMSRTARPGATSSHSREQEEARHAADEAKVVPPATAPGGPAPDPNKPDPSKPTPPPTPSPAPNEKPVPK